MENIITGLHSLIELQLLIEPVMETHYHENFELLYLLNGELTLTVEEEAFVMRQQDMILINSNRKHSYRGSDDVFIGRFVISYGKVQELIEQKMILFWCNSVLDKNEAYDELCKVITQILNQYVKYEAKRKIFLNSLYYQMLHILTANFLLTAKDIRYEAEKSQVDDRMEEIYQYIRSNYKESIKLQDLADQLYLSGTYLSKYIKKKCNVSFIELLNSVRLNYAMEDLLHTNASIMKIAMDNGFASVAAYNKAFKEVYHKTPSDFRKEIGTKRNKEDQNKAEKYQQIIQERVVSYLDQNPITDEIKSHGDHLECSLDLRKMDGRVWHNGCGSLINIGTASDLRKSVFREQVLYLKEHLGIKYVRFWDIYAPDLYLDINAAREDIHFGRIDEVLDFLIKNGLRPYIELGFKALRLLKNTQNALMEVTRDQKFKSDEKMAGFFGELMKHFVKRYGAEEVRTWYFEYWKKENLFFEDLKYQFQPLTNEAHTKYFKEFDIIAGVFRKQLKEVQIGGGGFSLQHYGKEGFMAILQSWMEHKEQPGFISLNCFPYQIEKDGNLYFEKKSTDMYFVQHKIQMAKEIIAEMNFPEVPLHISEYSLSLSNRNTMNDHCAKGAFLMQNAIATMETADQLGHWLATDTYADYQDTQKFLFGGCGILTKTGVPKPGFYAFEFLNQLYKTLLVKEKNYIVTENKRGIFGIASHNFKNLNYNYYLSDEEKIKVQDVPHMFEDLDILVLQVTLRGIENGVYAIKHRYVNQESGSVLDKWISLNMEKELSMQEQEYLKRISTPHMNAEEILVENNTLRFEIALEPNEIRFSQIMRR